MISKLDILAKKEEIDFEPNQFSLLIDSEKWEECATSFKKMFSKRRPVNIVETFSLIEENKSSAKKIKEKDVILLLGGTGAGKSTTIHYLVGSKMYKTEMKIPKSSPNEKDLYLTHVGPNMEEITNPQLKKVNCSPFMKSETRFITPISFTLPNSQKLPNSLRNKTAIIVDAPGYQNV